MTQDNPAAFPSRVDKVMMGGGSYRDDLPGMTLRDYFAGQVCEQALAEAFANDCLEGAAHTELCEWAALLTYKMADAMLAARATSKEAQGNG